MRFGEAKRLWGFDGSQVGAMAPIGPLDRRLTSHRCGMAMIARPDSGMTQRPRSRRFWQRKAKPSAIGGGRRKADVRVDATDAGAHAATRNVGGARIGCAAGEDLDDAHRGTAVRADEGGRRRWRPAPRLRRRFDRGGNDVQQFARLGEMLAASGIGEQAVVANAVEAAGQDVQQEAAHELVGARASWSCSASCPWRGSPSSGR